jgi:hypothetical protein
LGSVSQRLRILRSLQQEPDDWFYALRAITGENPVPASSAGDMRAMSEFWLRGDEIMAWYRVEEGDAWSKAPQTDSSLSGARAS